MFHVVRVLSALRDAALGDTEDVLKQNLESVNPGFI